MVVALLLGLGCGQARASFALGLQDDGFTPSGSAAQVSAAHKAISDIHGSYVRLGLSWAKVTGHTANFNQGDPGDPQYGWRQIDDSVRAAAARHLNVIFAIGRAPSWAIGPGPERPYVSDGAWDPNPGMYARFVHAAALRYSGHYPDPARPGARLPRVRYWEAWNEPNIPGFFSAQDQEAAYRNLLDIAYGQIKAIHRDNVVMMGGLAPVSPVPGSIPALHFAAAMMCLQSSGRRYVRIRSCRSARFDAIAVHPYALAATPTKHAYKSGDLLVGDIAELAALIRAAHRHYPVWDTEFSWFTNPPDTQVGDAPATAARYVAYSLYEMWKAGVSVVIWFQALDISSNDTFSGGGLFDTSGHAKPTLSALAFPFVAGVRHGHGFAWGRVPTSRPRHVVVQRLKHRRWVRVASARTGSDGVFSVGFRARRNGLYRAVVAGGRASLAYDSRPIPPRRTHLYQVF